MMNHLSALHSFFMKVSLSVSRMADAFLASLLLAMILAPSLDRAKLCLSSSLEGDASLGCGCVWVVAVSAGTSFCGIAVSFVSAGSEQTVMSAITQCRECCSSLDLTCMHGGNHG